MAKQALELLGVNVVLGSDRDGLRTMVSRADVVVPSPGIRPEHPALVLARDLERMIRSEIDMAAERIAVPMVAVVIAAGAAARFETAKLNGPPSPPVVIF